MARLGRGHPSRPNIVRPRRGVRAASLGLPAWETVPEWPTLQVTTPDVRLYPPPWETAPEWPALDIARHQYAHLPVWDTVPEWPDLEISVPVRPGDTITAPGQVELNGMLLGPGTPYRIAEITGWRSLPPVDDLAVDKPSQHGAWSGRRLAKQRLVTIRLSLIDSISDPTQIDSLLDDLDQVTGLGTDDSPIPLVIRGYGDPQLAYGVVIDRDIPMDAGYSNGSPTCSILIACRDPRRLSVQQHGVTIPQGTPTSLANTGNAASHPTIRIEGPAEKPTLVNTATSRTLTFNVAVSDGQVLLIDTANGWARIGDTNVLADVSGGGVPPTEFVLVPGQNPITYTTTSGGDDGADILWRDASH